MKKIIFDTDMGVDCDDAVALALLLNKQIKKEIEILCVSTSTTREGASATVRAIADYYGQTLTVGTMSLPAIPCDKINNYGKAVKEKYGTEDEKRDAVELLRETLAKQTEKITLIAVGPLTNMARLLQTQGDRFSPLNGVELMKEKIDCIFVMGGTFKQNYAYLEWTRDVFCEWNIAQDIPSARYFAEHCPVKTVFSPFEAGAKVLTKMREGENPVWFSMKQYAISEHFPYEPTFERNSWDPVTSLCAVDGCEEYYDYSPYGKITIDENGITSFEECEEGKDRILLLKDGYLDIADIINGSIDPIKE